jgi:surfactin synthase thioesterase subunit
MPAHRSSRWFYPATGGPDATLRLFLLPCAGGAASMYRDWASLLPADVASQCVQLPGRQERRAEAGLRTIEPLVAALEEELAAELDDRPYALFGHSMGAQIAYRLTVALERDGEVGPVLVGASAWAPVGFCPIPPEQADWPEARLAGWARQLGSLPPEVCDDPEMLALALPALRSDLAVVSSSHDDQARIRSPLVGYSGASDPLMPATAMASWSDRTDSYLGNRVLPGGHFYLADQGLAVTTDLVHLLRRLAHAEAQDRLPHLTESRSGSAW